MIFDNKQFYIAIKSIKKNIKFFNVIKNDLEAKI